MEKRVKQTIYEWVASDGKKFDSEYDCEVYEKELLAEKMNPRMKKIPYFQFDIPYADTDGEKDYFCYVTSDKDVETCMKFFYGKNNEFSPAIDRPKEYPCWLAFYVTQNGYGDSMGTADQLISVFRLEVDGWEKHMRTLVAEKEGTE